MTSRFPSESSRFIGKGLFSRSFRVYDRALRITREGWLLTGFIFLVGIAAVNTGNNLLYLILAVMLGAMIASGAFSEEMIRKIKLERELPFEAVAGTEFTVGYRIINPRRRMSLYGLRISEYELPARKQAFILRVQPGSQARGESACLVEKRGRLKLKTAIISTKFPFGFFEKLRLVYLPEEIIVFPRPADVSGRASSGSQTGSSDTSGADGEGPDLFSLRSYSEGDSMRSIHWKASARSETMITKITRAENLPTVTVILDTAGYAPLRDDDALELAVSEAAGYCEEFIRRNYMVRLVTPSGEVPYGAGGGHRRRLLTALALFEPPMKPQVSPSVRPDERKVVAALRKKDNFGEQRAATA